MGLVDEVSAVLLEPGRENDAGLPSKWAQHVVYIQEGSSSC